MHNSIRSTFFFLLFILTLSAYSSDLQLVPYGFIKGEMIYSSGGVYSWGKATNNYISSAQFASGDKNSALGFTAQHTRFGLKGSIGEKVKVGGKIELDFYVGAHNANANPRMRLAYAWIQKGAFTLLIGQQWDIFSPINAATNNTNGNMWYAGNSGFRRGQIQINYNMGGSIIKFSAGETTKEAAGLGADNLSGLPLIQGSFTTKLMDKFTVGAYFAYASYSPNPDNSSEDFTTSGFGVDFILPFSPAFTVKGEVNSGTNLNNANLFTAAGSGSSTMDARNLGYWLYVVSKFSDTMHGIIGFGQDQNKTNNLASGMLESNTVVYGDLVFPFENGFSLSAEVESINTALKGGSTNSAVIFNIAGKVTF